MIQDLFSTEKEIKEIKEAYPESRVVNLGMGDLFNPTTVFIKDQSYSDDFDRARFYAMMTPACFLQADLYKGDDYQYSITISSGAWRELLKELEETVERVAKEGLEVISDEIETDYFGKMNKPLE